MLGYAGMDNKGLEGLERSLDKVLSGRPGSQTVVKDSQGRALDVVSTRPETPGKNVRLTIDHQIQANAEDVLADTVSRYGAKAASAIVMDPQTGAILAMAVAPGYNANRFPTTRADRRRNRAVTDTYEPGSTFKLVTVAAALEEGAVTPQTTFRLPPQLRVADRVIREAHTRGTVQLQRPPDRRVLVEHRDDRRRAEARRGAALVLGRPLRLREADRDRLPGRVAGLRAAARPVVGLDDRHRPDRARHRGHADPDGTRVRGGRERRHGSSSRTSSSASTA